MVLRVFAARVALILGSLLFSLVILEAGIRVIRSGPEGLVQWSNLARNKMATYEDGDQSCAYGYDDMLGWTSPRNCDFAGYYFVNGIRRTPEKSAVVEPPILATGSSFALGQEEKDDETWPTNLQNLTGRKVINAGVSGYSLDQTVLRTEQLAPQVKPLLAVVSFTPDDIRRNELKVAWSREKPYFEVADGRLELRNVPVPGRRGAAVPLPWAARVLGWSVLADEVVQRLGWQNGWFFDDIRALPRGIGDTVSCLLMSRLARIGVPVMIVAQYDRLHWMNPDVQSAEQRDVAKVLECASKVGVIPFDLADPLKAEIDAHGIDSLYGKNHHSAQGDRVVAELIRQEIIRRHLQ
jgi:hypothetical protein